MDDLLGLGIVATTSAKCVVHVNHSPVPRVNVIHHVWPKGKGGPDVAENRIVVCPTGHYNIHKLLAEYEKANGDPGAKARQPFTSSEQQFAALGFERIQNGHM